MSSRGADRARPESARGRVRRRPVYLVAGLRTPFAPLASVEDSTDPLDRLVPLAQRLLAAATLQGDALDTCVLATAAPLPGNAAADLALRLGRAHGAQAFTVAGGMLTGLTALGQAAASIAAGDAHLGLVASVDTARVERPVLSDAGAQWFDRWLRPMSLPARLGLLGTLRPHRLARASQSPLLSAAGHAGQHAEALADRLGIERDACDQLAASSVEKLRQAELGGAISERVTAFQGGRIVAADGRDPTSVDPVRRRRPLYDRRYGLLNAGNSGELADGAVVCLLASTEALSHYGLQALVKISDVAHMGGEAGSPGLAMAAAVAQLLQRRRLAVGAVDAWELDEFLAVPLLGLQQVFASESLAAELLGLPSAPGVPDPARVNRDGGTIAIGHALAGTGLRLLVHLARGLAGRGRRGIAASGGGSGEGIAVLVEAP